MRTLEVRRHSRRKHGGGSQLSQDGVEYARRLGATMGPFTQVVTSVVPRARETAIAMGFAVDHEVVTMVANDALYAEAEGTRWWEAPEPFAALAAVIATGPGTRRYADALAAVWRDLLTPLPEGGSVLLISHSGDLEMGLVGCMPNADHRAWGGLIGPCEGARLVFDGEPARFTTIEMIRG